MKFKIGDKVKVKDYGHIIFSCFDGNKTATDISPEVVGKTGIVTEILHNTYALSGIPEKIAWYKDDQLELCTD